MSISIDTYKPKYLPQQVELSEKIKQDWPLATQKSIEELRQVYQAEDFDPNLNFYALQDTKVVGYLTVTKHDDIAEMEFPIVLDHNTEIGCQLFDYVLDQLKELGISQIQASASSVWGKTEVYAVGYGFQVDRVLIAQGSRLVRALPEVIEDLTIRGNFETEKLLLHKIMENLMRYSPKYINKQLDTLEKVVQDWHYYRLDEEIIGNALVIREPADSNRAYIFHFYFNALHKAKLGSFINNILANLDEDLEYVDVVLSGNFVDYLDIFESKGFKFTKINQYSKLL